MSGPRRGWKIERTDDGHYLFTYEGFDRKDARDEAWCHQSLAGSMVETDDRTAYCLVDADRVREAVEELEAGGSAAEVIDALP